MRTSRILLTLLVCAASLTVYGQSSDEAAKERLRRLTLVIDHLVAEAGSFQLSANRAYVLARTGKSICTLDRDRAGELFRSSLGELANAQASAVEMKKGNLSNDLLNSLSIRPAVLRAIAECDGELALQGLYRTRPAAVELALAGSREKSSKIGDVSNNFAALALNENALEQGLMRCAADQSPERAVQLLKESLKKGITSETFTLLQRLNAKDPDEAARIAASVIDKVGQKAFVKSNPPDYQALAMVMAFLSDFPLSREPNYKGIKYDDSVMRALAERAIAFYLEQSNGYSYLSAQTLIRVAEKLSPSNVNRIKAQEQANTARFGGGQVTRNAELNTLMSSNPTAERLMSEAKNFSNDERRQILYAAANKLADRDEYNAAVAMVNDNFSGDVQENAIQSLNWYYAHRLMNLGKYPEAERFMNEFPENNRNAALINLAQVVYAKDKEKYRDYAMSILDRVRSQMPQRPPTQAEMGYLMQLVMAYIKIGPEQAFSTVESLVPQVNELCDASIMIYSFQGGWNMQQGEGIISQGLPFPSYIEPSVFQGLADKDLERTVKLIEQFSRVELRTTFKLQLLESVANK
jgi:hypothetical protein